MLLEATGDWDVSLARGKAARMGDEIRYPDGTTARIVTGVGLASAPSFVPLAIVGSELDNGDIIADSPDREEHATMLIPVRQATLTQ